MEKARIAIVAYSAPPFSAGGVASAHFNLFKAMQRKGFEARLFTFGDDGRVDEDTIVRHGSPSWYKKFCYWLNGVVSALFGRGKTIYQVRDILACQWGAKRMNKAIAEFDPQVVILSDHGAPGLALQKRQGMKVVLVSHHNPARFQDTVYFPEYSIADTRLAIWLENRVMKKIDLVVCPSNYMAEWFQRSYQFAGPLRVIPNIVDDQSLEDIQALDLRPHMGLPASAPLIYLPSAGSHMKGAAFVPDLIRGLAEAARGVIGFYMPGEVDESLRPLLRELEGQARVHAPGQVEYSQHIAMVKACSFGIAPSLLENYSMALLEAVNCGVPMLAFASGGNPDIIHPGKNGYLVRMGDGHGLVEKAQTLLDLRTLARLRQSTLQYSRKTLSPRRAVDAYIEAIEWLSPA